MSQLRNSIPIKGFLESSFLDWPGKIVSVVFLPSCNFRCPYCQNSDLVLKSHLLNTLPFPYVLQRLQKLRDWIDGVCITGGEPTIHETLADFISVFKNNNFLVKLDTNGSNPRMLEALLNKRLVDCIAMDVKAPLDKDFYSRLIGVSADLKKIRESIDLIRNSSVENIFRTTVVPGMLSEEDIYQVAKGLSPVKKFILQQFSPENPLDPKLRKVSPWPQKKLERTQRMVNQIIKGYKENP